jgi:hypothetical protein
MFCMAGVPSAGALIGPCIRGWKGKFPYIKKLFTCVLKCNVNM